MAADTGVRLSVWVLGEFAFCPRAGLIAYRSRFDGERHQEDDAGYGRLDFLPDFDAAAVERAIATTRRRLATVWVVAAWVAVAVYILGDQVSRGFWGAGAVLFLPLPGWTRRTVTRLRELLRYAQQFRGGEPTEPDPTLSEPVGFDWWDFHRAGFRVVKPRDHYHDPGLNLDGRPWRVLVRGSLRIPVFRKHKGELTAGRSQFATLAAYSHLLRVCEGGESPYGVILYPGTWTVLVVPDQHAVPSTAAAVEQFLAVRDRDDHGRPPDPPPGASACRGCPHGQPKGLVTDTPATWETVRTEWDEAGTPVAPERQPSIHVLDGESIRPHVVHGLDGHRYHSLCGDLFGWIPPHDSANRLALRTIPHPQPADDEYAPPAPILPPVVIYNVIPSHPGAALPPGVTLPAAVVGPTPLPVVPLQIPAPSVTHRPAAPPPTARPPVGPPPATRPESPTDDEEFGAGIL